MLRYGLPTGSLCHDHSTTAEQLVAAKVPFITGTRAIRIFRDEVLIHEVEVPRSGPAVRLAWRIPRTGKGRQVIRWTAEHPEGRPVHFVLAYSHNDGSNWMALCFSGPDTEQEVDFDLLPGGDRCRIAVMATDGVNTVNVSSRPFKVPIKPCTEMILAPAAGTRFARGEPVQLRGQGNWLEEGSSGARAARLEFLCQRTAGHWHLCTGFRTSGGLAPY